MSAPVDHVTPAQQLADALRRLEDVADVVRRKAPGVEVSHETLAQVVSNLLDSAAQLQASNEVLSAACEGYQVRISRLQGR